MNLYLIKRGPRPEWHHANFHPLLITDRAGIAKGETLTSLDEHAWMWLRFGADEYAGGWRLSVWEGLDVDGNRPTGRHADLPDGTHPGFFHDRDKEPWTLIEQCIWWSPRPVPQWLVGFGVCPPSDDWSLQRISELGARRR